MSRDLHGNSWGIKRLALFGIFGVALVFTYFKTHDLLFGQGIVIESPNNGVTVEESLVKIVGVAPGSTILTVGGAKVVPDQSGRFFKETILGVGYNVIDIVSVDHFNRETSERLELVYRPKATTSENVAFINF
jgi:hypothetical protein